MLLVPPVYRRACRVAVVLDTLSASCCFVRGSLYGTFHVAKTAIAAPTAQERHHHRHPVPLVNNMCFCVLDLVREPYL